MRAFILATAATLCGCGASSQLASVDAGDAGDAGDGGAGKDGAIVDTGVVTDAPVDTAVPTISAISSLECGPTDAPMLVIVIATTRITCDARSKPPEIFSRVLLYSPPKGPTIITLTPTSTDGSAMSCAGSPSSCTPISKVVLELTDVSKSGTVGGNFTFTAADGTERRGSFDATNCGSFLGCG